ncbi:DEAD/DEAH box helicase family protein [Cetobacterium sp. 8H]|uniref:DEAD/DEAH box helicase family protein n=1 Tax=Cetobacterium sp. 8H TaxID=2759681 RepID=UPI00163BCC4C|nr:DEAD/DEAH box helicase family protein [Cetobacterium sp. 8H]MBC2849987.1 DEAD/DEAH box helicase family protein [Cetobacterium sp. 8H]
MLISNNKNTMYETLKNSINNCEEIIMNVPFIRDSGLKLLIPELLKAKNAGKNIKILTSDYMKVTEPNALYRLLDIPGVKIFNNPSNRSFHEKTYVFKNKNKIEIYVGSSNISYSELVSGVEWNYYFNGDSNQENINDILLEFNELYEKCSYNLTLDWLRSYEKSYEKKYFEKLIDPQPSMEIMKKLEPIKFQVPALYELSKTREEGYKKAMVVVGTGLGKTYLSAFDSMSFNKILFVAHRDEILRDAKKTFETVYKDTKSYGFFNGYKKEVAKDITFATVITLSKDEYLADNYFSKEYFDYIVIDEFHHSSAPSYLKLLDYFKPKFLLGLTATPDRADSGDVYRLCDYNIAYECDFRVGINNGWLTPFEYFGIYDDTDYSLIPWRSGKYDLEALENSLIIEKRLELVYKKYIEFRKTSTIAFCASVKHCKVMQHYFSDRNIKSEIVIGDTSVEKRQEIIFKLKEGKLDIIFTVDVFNEGVDIPCIDTILFLRPTNSYTIFIQQLGRGLRTFEGKEKLRVLDFVGNFKGAELRPAFLSGSFKGERKPISPLDSNFILPSGCSANFDFKIIEYFEKNKDKRDNLKEKLYQDFLRVKEVLSKNPSIMDIFTFGEFPVHIYLQKYKSWYQFLKEIDGLKKKEKLFSERGINFLEFLEKTAMTKSYKIPLLLSLFKDGLKEEVTLKEIGKFYKEFYGEDLHGKDLTNKRHDDWKNWHLKKFEVLAKDNPIHFLTKDGKNEDFFSFSDDKFKLNDKLFKEIEKNKELLENILDRLEYRNKNYFRRKYMEG